MKKILVRLDELKTVAPVSWRFRKPLPGSPEFASDPRGRLLELSWRRSGITGELTVLATDDGLILIDGYRRIDFARRHEVSQLPAILLEATETVAAMEQIMLNEFDLIEASSARKAAFVAMLAGAGIDEDTLLHTFLPLIGMEPHPGVLLRCCRIGELGRDVIEFCHEKDFALSQCYHLTRRPAGLVNLVLGWRERLALSASHFEKILDMLRDLMVARSLSDVQQLATQLGLTGLLNAVDLNPGQRTRALVDALRALRMPCLTQKGAILEKLRDDMHLPHAVTLSWDPTLEKEGLNLCLALRAGMDVPGICHKLGSGEVVAQLDRMLEELE